MTQHEDIMLRLDHLSVGYGRRTVVEDATTSVGGSQVIALVGANGCGKSTLLKTISGELRPVAGSVMIGGRNLSEMSGRELASKVAIVTSGAEAAGGGLRVRQLVSLGRQPYTGFFGKLSASDTRIINEAMEATGISGKQDAYVATLSDGERQKAMISRAIAQQTPFLLLDEPFSFLDPAARIEIFAMLGRLASAEGKLIVLSTHDIAQALRMVGRLWTIADGRFLSLTPREIIGTGTINRLYPGRDVTFDPEAGDFLLNHKNA